MSYGLFIFRRDLRITDNLALNKLAEKVDFIIPIFILDPNQIIKNNKNRYYFSNNAVQFICESLEYLNKQIHLHLFMTCNFSKLLNRIFKKCKISYVAFNDDISPYAQKRDNEIIKTCKLHNIECIVECNDDLLIKKYKYSKVFSVFYKYARKQKIDKPHTHKTIFKKINFSFAFPIKKLNTLYDKNIHIAQHPNDHLSHSATLNMGLISIREFYHKIKKSNIKGKRKLLRSLFWRDFFKIFFVNNKISFTKYINPRFDKIKWRPHIRELKLLYNSKTGFPQIDAAMKELITTGFTNNRNRMLLAIFWTKYLHINMLDKKYGAQTHFSKHLIDAIGVSQNLGNQHFMVDTDYGGYRFGRGISGRPMRIDKFDREYVLKWLPNYTFDKPIFNMRKRYDQWINITKKL